ncbi:DUF4227 family protein [Virgibacillus soli]|uniref:DUF4227 family protein n=1 Tax=Paracerasibacillus soli TaxID=480284 RepID=A0ABU5CPS4_9BACI|nr:DUF4227 family protein [Virgibacillus soli]MDY0408366.1 DUF4227 family protein [Virgibacillus soli]
MIFDSIKVFIIFLACTIVFYFGLRAMHSEYEQFHRYDHPDGPAVKVFNSEEDFLNRFQLFFRFEE